MSCLTACLAKSWKPTRKRESSRLGLPPSRAQRQQRLKGLQMGTKSDKELPQPATVRPGDFPLGSPESRAAARAMVKAQEAEEPFIILTFNIGAEPMVHKFYRER